MVARHDSVNGDDNSSCSDCGSYAADSDEEDAFHDDAEEVLQYHVETPFCPIMIGQVYASRYRVEHKLGHGGYATVWMAYDMLDRKLVALKVAKLTDKGADREFQVHERIRQRLTSTSNLHLSQDKFEIHLDTSKHNVLVFPLRGPSLETCFGSFTLRQRMSIGKQVLQALADLQDARVVHRDLNDRNILCGIVPLESYGKRGRYRLLGRPKKLNLGLIDGYPGAIVRPVNVPATLLTDSAYLADLGISIEEGDSVTYKPQNPIGWSAPERLIGGDPAHASDMWSFMLIFARLYLGHYLWSPNRPPVHYMTSLLGPMPAGWYENYDRKESQAPKEWFTPIDRLENPLNAVIDRSRLDASPEERAHVFSFMKRTLHYDPKQRLTARELIEDSSFKAVMQIYGL